MEDKQIPYQNNYDQLKKFRKISMVLLIAISLFSLVMPLLVCFKCDWLVTLLRLSYIILLVVYYVLDRYTELVLTPNAAVNRRKGFIDNSLGTKLLDKELKGYFSNDNVEQNVYKLAVNCYENCFFTYNIADKMTISITIQNSVLFLFLLVCAYFGFKDNIFIVSVFQIAFSCLFFDKLLHHWLFKNRLGALLNSFQQYFASNTSEHFDVGLPFYYVLNYETILAYNKSPLSDKVFKELNPSLSEEWEEIKKRYEIR